MLRYALRGSSSGARGKGVFYNELLELDWNHVSPVNLNLDLCVRVKATLAEPDRR